MKFTYSSGQRPLEGYTIKRGIGRGGFGEVYYALSDGGKEVALKLICGNVDVELRGMAQCLNFKHPNLVELYDLRTDQHGDHWVVMEYVTGETLNNVLNRHPNGLAPELAGQWFLGISGAIEYLHDRGVVHRDLKPGNVFLENGNVMVGDFGLARFISGSERNALTQSIGTVHYMAPEISSGNYNKQIDIYAGGIVLYEMLTGHVPFDGESAGEILMKHLTTPPDLARVPAPFRRILEQSLAKDPARRYASIAEMAKDVATLIPGVPPTAKLTPLPIPHPATRAQGAPPLPIPTVMPARIPIRIRLSELAGSMIMSAVLALLFCIVWAAVQRTNDPVRIAPYFFLTLACSWAVLLPAKMWTTRLEDSWRRRLILTGLGVLIGAQALWLEGYDMPALFTPEARAAEDTAIEPTAPRKDSRPSGFAGGWLLRGREVPVAASYLAYFGLVFFFVRWWRLADRRRSRRFSLGTVLMAGIACWLVTLFVWPSDESARAALIDPFMVIAVPASAALVIQLVSPWEAPPRARDVGCACPVRDHDNPEDDAMRCWTRLQWMGAIVCLLAATCWVRASGQTRPAKKGQATKAAAAAKKNDPVVTWKIDGRGVTVADAEKHMFTKVPQQLMALEAPVIWTSPLEDLRKHIETGQPELDPEKKTVNGEEVQRWWWTISLTSKQLKAIRAEDAKNRAKLAVQERSVIAEARILEMGKYVGLFVLVLAGVWLSFGIERWTGHAGRSWSRMGLAGIVLAGGAALLLWMGISKSTNLLTHPSRQTEPWGEGQSK